MIHLLDTNVCIRYLNGQSESIRSRIEQSDPASLALCSVVKAELLFGARKSQASVTNFERLRRFFSAFASFPFDDQAAEVYGEIRGDLETRGKLIGANDLLIAAIAVAQGAILVTANRREFSRVSRLNWVDWEG